MIMILIMILTDGHPCLVNILLPCLQLKHDSYNFYNNSQDKDALTATKNGPLLMFYAHLSHSPQKAKVLF